MNMLARFQALPVQTRGRILVTTLLGVLAGAGFPLLAPMDSFIPGFSLIVGLILLFPCVFYIGYTLIRGE